MDKGERAIMIIFLLGIAVIISAIAERILSIKKSNYSNIIIILRILIVVLLFSISYFITDTWSGWVYVIMVSGMSVFLVRVIHSKHLEPVKYFIFILAPPVIAYLIVRSYQNILIDFNFFLILIISLRLIYAYPQIQNSRKQNIALGLGIAMAISFIFIYYNPYDEETDVLRKQEIVAKEFLEEELGLYGLEIYARLGYNNIRSRETNVVAFDSSGNINISMIYKNNRIISYQEESIFDIIKKML